jgi:three-Cys-motif partner protein
MSDNSIQLYEDAKYHSRQKHQLLRSYLDIWNENVGRKSDNIPTLEIYDLYASYGKCKCVDNNEIWDGTAIIAAKCLAKYSRSKHLLVNCYSENKDEMKIQQAALQYHLKEISFPEEMNFNIIGKDIVQATQEALTYLDKRYPSIWILDPYSPSTLPWSVVESIATQSYSFRYENQDRIRRPELFITLMISSLARFSGMDDKQKQPIDICLGMERDDWEREFKDLQTNGLDAQKAFLEIYGSKLEMIYDKKPIAITIEGTQGNHIYAVFIVTDSNAGHYMMKVRKLKEYNKWKEYQWKPEAKHLSARKREQKKASEEGLVALQLDDF